MELGSYGVAVVPIFIVHGPPTMSNPRKSSHIKDIPAMDFGLHPYCTHARLASSALQEAPMPGCVSDRRRLDERIYRGGCNIDSR